MSAPIVYISHNRVKEGKFEGFVSLYREVVKSIEAERPGTLVHLAYVDEARARVTIVHLFPDADAFDRHLQGVDEKAKRAYEYIEAERLELYGTPNPGVLEMITKIASAGAVLSVHPEHVGGYIRPGAG